MIEATVVGAGLAGCEAAFQLAVRGVRVKLCEMRPHRMTPAHRTASMAELVCSNSLRSENLENAVGLLKQEMRRAGSIIMQAAERSRVPAGQALAVDRAAFSASVERLLMSHPGVSFVRGEVERVPDDGIVVIATGPLTSDALAAHLGQLLGEGSLFFFDAIAPILTAASVDRGVAFLQSRYGEPAAGDYLNCPMNEEEYGAFVAEITSARRVALRDFESDLPLFEGCLPIEEMARRGHDTLRFGPLRPTGLVDPRTGERPHAVVQLRQDDAAGERFNMVGFQTNLTFPEQDRVFRLIPGLGRAEFERHGTIHRNSYLNSPTLLAPSLQVRWRPALFVAGQLSGVEGYVESAASGMMAGINAAAVAKGQPPQPPPRETAMGSLAYCLAHGNPLNFLPQKASYGLMPDLPRRIKDKVKRRRLMARRAIMALDPWLRAIDCGMARAALAA